MPRGVFIHLLLTTGALRVVLISRKSLGLVVKALANDKRKIK